MSKTINVGRVTSYADAVAGGYTGTREEWEIVLANLGTTAAEVEANRQAVADDKAAVEGDVTTVGEYKDVASEAAAAALQSAESAHTDALAATAAKEAAQTAQGLADEARADAVSAKGAAESAQTEANASATAATEAALAAGNAATTATTQASAASESAAAASASAASVSGVVQEVTAAKTEAISAIETKGAETLDSIPDDYTELSGDVDDLKSAVDDIENILPQNSNIVNIINADTADWDNGHYYAKEGAGVVKRTYDATSCRIYGDVKKDDEFRITARSTGSAYAIILCDHSGNFIESLVSPSGDGYYNDVHYKVPADGIMYLNTVKAAYITSPKRYQLNKYIYYYKSLYSPLKGVKWYTIGDSLNAFSNTDPNWIRYMTNDTLAENHNLAASGTGFYRGAPQDGSTGSNYINKISSIANDAELITIAGSFNDLMSSPWPALPIGTDSDTGDTSIAGYINAFFDALLTAFPTTPIGVYMTSPWDNYKPGNANSDAYVTVLRTICQKRGIPFNDDCYYGCNLKPWLTANITEYYTRSDGTVDGVHPNSKGHIFIYRMLKPFLEKFVYTTE